MDPQNHFAYLTASLYARQAGLSLDESDDCAIEFMEKECQKAGGLENLHALCHNSPALVRKCASDYVRNFTRARRRKGSHDSEWPQVEGNYGETKEWEATANQPEPDKELVEEAFWDILLPFLEKLSLDQYEYFIRHYLRGETVAEIARSASKTTHSVEQSLYRSREKLRTNLESAQLSYSVLRQFLSPPPATNAPGSSV